MKKVILSIMLAMSLCSCETLAKKYYGITNPKPETIESIRRYAQKINLEEDNMLVLKNPRQYNAIMQDFNGGIPEAILFDANGNEVAYKKNKEDCNAGLFSTLPNLDKNTVLSKEDLRLADFQKNFVQLDGSALSEMPKADYYLFINWAKFMGKLNKDHVKVWEEITKDNKNVKIQVYKVNMDIQKNWNVNM